MRLRRTRRGWEEQAPTRCANGRPLKGNALVGVAHCDCGIMHRTHYCKTCGDTEYTPPRRTICHRRDFDDRDPGPEL